MSDLEDFLNGRSWLEVDSSWIRALRYNPDRQVLTLRLKDGKEWPYEGISAAKAEEMARAPSHGTWYWANLPRRKRS